MPLVRSRPFLFQFSPTTILPQKMSLLKRNTSFLTGVAVGLASAGAVAAFLSFCKLKHVVEQKPTDENTHDAKENSASQKKQALGDKLQRFSEYTTVDAQELFTFAEACLVAAGCSKKNAAMATEVILAADLRGITSHGVQRLHLYCEEVRSGVVNGQGRPRHIQGENELKSAVAIVDGCNAQGAVVGHFCTELAIAKARQFGIGLVVARNSNHYGIAGFYAEAVARKHGFIGMSMTNTSAIATPTGSSTACLGTNPIAFAAPCGDGRPPVVIDMATTTVPFGKVEVYARKGDMLPSDTWAVDGKGRPCRDAYEVIHGGGSVLPLGGASKTTGGHKGYCLMVMVELLCGVLAGYPARFGKQVGMSMNPRAIGRKDGGGSISHFFLVIDPNAAGFGRSALYGDRVSQLVEQLVSLPRANNLSTIRHDVDNKSVRVPGSRAEAESRRRQLEGIPIHHSVMISLEKLAAESQVALPQEKWQMGHT